MQTVTQIQKQIEDQLIKIKESYNTFLVTDNYDPYKVQTELHNLYLLCNKQEQYLLNIVHKDNKEPGSGYARWCQTRKQYADKDLKEMPAKRVE